ncbi:MAG TPA: DUF262 domain-containing protein, partial [Hyphomicrobiaceae bacterium]
RVLPFVFDLVNLVNDLPIADSSKKHSIKGDVGVSNDPDGRETIKYLTNVRSMLERICSVHPSSLGLHPAVYFYSRRGVFQPQALLSFIAFFKAFKTDDYKQFTTIRRKFEEFLIANRGVSEVVHTLGSGARSRPRMVSLYRKLQAEFSNGASIDEVERKLAHDPDFSFLFGGDDSPSRAKGTKFKRDTKGAAFLRDALPNASRCQTCGGLLHRNGIQTGHLIARREGGTGSLDNAILQHPFCNSTVAN